MMSHIYVYVCVCVYVCIYIYICKASLAGRQKFQRVLGLGAAWLDMEAQLGPGTQHGGGDQCIVFSLCVVQMKSPYLNTRGFPFTFFFLPRLRVAGV